MPCQILGKLTSFLSRKTQPLSDPYEYLPPLVIRDVRESLPIHPDKKYKKRSRQFTHVAIHHSATSVGNATTFARYHVNDKHWPGIGYTYVIWKDGTIEWCWDDDVRTYHVGNSNDFALGIVNVGEYNSEIPSHIQWDTCIRLVNKVAPIIPVENVLGHQEYQDYQWKKCPGDHWNMDKFREELQQFREGTLKFPSWGRMNA